MNSFFGLYWNRYRRLFLLSKNSCCRWVKKITAGFVTFFNSTAVFYFAFFFFSSCACTCLNREFLHLTSSNRSWWVLSLANELNCRTPTVLHANRVQKLCLGSRCSKAVFIHQSSQWLMLKATVSWRSVNGLVREVFRLIVHCWFSCSNFTIQ